MYCKDKGGREGGREGGKEGEREGGRERKISEIEKVRYREKGKECCISKRYYSIEYN